MQKKAEKDKFYLLKQCFFIKNIKILIRNLDIRKKSLKIIIKNYKFIKKILKNKRKSIFELYKKIT